MRYSENISKRLLGAAVTAFVVCAVCMPVSAAVPEPSYPPLKNEYYPVQNSKFPKAVTNPNAHTRNIAFRALPWIYSQRSTW